MMDVSDVPMKGWPSVPLCQDDAGKILCVIRSTKDGGKLESEEAKLISPQELETTLRDHGPKIDLRWISDVDVVHA